MMLLRCQLSQPHSCGSIYSVAKTASLFTAPTGAAVLCRLHSILAAQQAAGATILMATDNPAAYSSITRTVYVIDEGTLHPQGQ
jgi:hypothetical protein